jgi:acetyl esterase/lipase
MMSIRPARNRFSSVRRFWAWLPIIAAVLPLVVSAGAAETNAKAQSKAGGKKGGAPGGGKVSVPPGVKFLPDLAYREGASAAWKLDLAMPDTPATSPRPGLVIVHGGGWVMGDKRQGVFQGEAFSYARKGYVCINVNYRLTKEAPFPAALEDVKCAVRWFRAHAKEYNVDPNRIGGFGTSAGAHLVSMLALVPKEAKLEGDGPYQDQSSLLQAVVASATPTDLGHWDEAHKGSFDMAVKPFVGAEPADTFQQRADNASPIHYAKAGAPPFLFVQGTADEVVPPAQADKFVEALKKAGNKDVTLLKIDGGHHDAFFKSREQTEPAMEAFFARTLSVKSK